jgi:hypothetical protein
MELNKKYLLEDDKANDADRLDGLDSTDFVKKTDAAPNADKLDGLDASDFLRAEGTAVNSLKLGGQPASAFLPATATAKDSERLGGYSVSSFLKTTGKAADADKFDGLNSTDFVRYKADGSISNSLASAAYVAASSGSNVDHLWHDENLNTWHFCSDVGFKATGNSTVQAGTFNEGGQRLVDKYLTKSGKAADSDKLDGLQSTSFLRSNASDAVTAGGITFNDNVYLKIGSSSDAEFFSNNSSLYTDINNGFKWYIRDGSVSNATRYTFDVSKGSFTATGNVTAYSDRRVKTNIEPIEDALEKIEQLGGYTFDRTDIEAPRQTGVIAQEVQAILPEAVSQDEHGKLSVAYGNMAGLFIEAINELSATVREQAKEIAELRALHEGV